MKKIKNPYTAIEGYNCFGCSPDNKHGLQMEFYEDGDYIVCDWNPRHHLQGYVNILHGGIQATLLDEIANWVVNVKLKTGGVTSHMEVSLKKPVRMDKAPLKIRARILELTKKIVTVYTELLDNEGTLCAEGNIQYYIYPEELARKKLFYPGIENFFE